MDNTIDHTFESANRVYDKNNLCPTIPTCAGGGIQPKIIEETKCCVAMRGRTPDNPGDRTRGAKMEQRLEMNKDGLVNTLTTVQKDNMVLEENTVVDMYNKRKINGDVCGTITANGNSSSTHCGTFGIIKKVGQISSDGSQCGTVVSEKGLFPTLTAGTHGYANNCILNKEGVKNEDERKENLLQILRERIEKESFCEWAIRGLFCILQTQILQQNVYAERLFENWKTSTELEQFTHNGTIDKQFVATTDSVRDLWEVWETECSSYRRQFSEQQFIEFKSFMQKLPHEDTQTKIFMFYLREASEGIWVLRKALSEIQEIWKPTSDKQGSWSYRIRKLTPREVWRLMGYTDTDFDKAAAVNSNTQLYKEAGNAIVKQVLMAIFSQMNIKGVKPWNDMTSEEKYNLIQKSTTEKKSKKNNLTH